MVAFGRIPDFDEKSRGFRVTAVIPPELPLRSYTWSIEHFLDQGSEGACVGFAFAHELIARPFPIWADAIKARQIYWDAQHIDEWDGGAYPGAAFFYEGTSVLAGAKILYQQKYYREYRWAFSEREVALALGYRGPVVLGINWYTGMVRPDVDGFIRPTGQIEGGHAILTPSLSLKGNFYWLHNSWGRSWGLGGRAKILRHDLARLLSEAGEACMPVRTGAK